MNISVTIDFATQGELWSVTGFWQAEDQNSAEIHRRITRVYGDKDGRIDVHNEGGQVQKSVVKEYLVS